MSHFPQGLGLFVRQNGKFVFRASEIDYFVGQHPRALIIQYADDWTFPRLSKHPHRQNFKEPMLWLAMVHKNQLLGMAIINRPSEELAAIISFKIHPEYRNKKIGTALLAFCEKVCGDHKVKQLLLNYRTYWKNNAYWEKILSKREWGHQSPNMYYVYAYDTDAVYEGMSLHDLEQPNTISIDNNNWERLKETIARREWQGEVPDALNPLQLADKQLDKQASLLLLDDENKDIVGWCIIHQMSSEAWQVTSLYVKETHRKSKVGFAMMREMVKRHKKRGRMHFMVQPENVKFLIYIRRYMLRWNCDLFSQEIAHKKLG